MVAQARYNKTLSTTGLVGTSYPTLGTGVTSQQATSQLDTTSLQTLSFIIDPTAVSVGTQTFTYAGTGNIVTTGSNKLVTGQVVTLTTAGTLPTGVGTGTNYYAIAVGTAGTSVEFATSLANALGGTAIALSGLNTNTGTINPTSLSATVQQQVQNGTSSWVNYGTSNTITSGTAVVIENDVVAFAKTRLQVVVAAGQLNLNVSPCGKVNWN